MASRSTEYRKRKGLSQVVLPWDEQTWAEAMELTGAISKRGAVEELLRHQIAVLKREKAIRAECAKARAEALKRMEES